MKASRCSCGERIDANIDSSGANDVIWRTLGVRESGLQQRIHIPLLQSGACKRLGQVIHLSATKTTWRQGEEQIALGEEKCEGARLCGPGF